MTERIRERIVQATQALADVELAIVEKMGSNNPDKRIVLELALEHYADATKALREVIYDLFEADEEV